MIRPSRPPGPRDAAVVARALDVLPGIVRVLQQAAAGPGFGGAAAGLTLTQFRLLKRISEGCVRTSDLASRLEVTPTTVSGAVDVLVRRGLVTRLPAEGDRRAVPLGVTADGDAALAAGRHRQEDALADLLSALTPREVRALAVGLVGLQRALADRRGH